MIQKVLVIGADGFIGSWVLPALRDAGFEAEASQASLFDYAALCKGMERARWDCVIHLAGMSHVPSCDKDPELAYRTNVSGTLLLLEALRERAPAARLIFPSTAQVYAAPTAEESSSAIVFTEERRILPQNVYARTKWAAEVALRDWSERTGTPVSVFRIFNHTHRSQRPEFLLPHVYAELSRGKTSVPIGNLDLNRDIGAIQDLVSGLVAYLKAAKGRPSHETFNLCSGRAKNLRRLVDGLALRMKKSVEWKVDPTRLRPGEPVSLVGSCEKLARLTGWHPSCLTEEDLLDRFLA